MNGNTERPLGQTGARAEARAEDRDSSPSPAAHDGERIPVSALARPRIGRGFRLQWEPAQNAHVLLYPEGMVKLNTSAGEIMSRCNGKRTLAEIVAELEHAFGMAGLSGEVSAFVSLALEKKWLEAQT